MVPGAVAVVGVFVVLAGAVDDGPSVNVVPGPVGVIDFGAVTAAVVDVPPDVTDTALVVASVDGPGDVVDDVVVDTVVSSVTSHISSDQALIQNAPQGLHPPITQTPPATGREFPHA